MILRSITLTDFRNYPKATFSFPESATVIVGPNAIGKTNILEAISLIAGGQSFRAQRESEMIMWGKDIGRVSAKTLEDTLEIVITTGLINGKRVQHKRYLVNGVPRRMVDFVGRLPAVVFWPEDLELVTRSPSLRRRHLDSVLVQVDREYRRNLQSYERGLRQRNKLLDLIADGQASRSQLLFWNQLLIKSGGYITDARAAYLDAINSFRLPGFGFRLRYDKSVISEARLEQYAQEEISAKSTLVGPHRDDVLFLKVAPDHRQTVFPDDRMTSMHGPDVSAADSGVSLASYGSRGEQRMAILWLKLGELAFMQNRLGERPVLLLDDIFSELDEGHRHLVFEIIRNQQTIITSADGELNELLQTDPDHRPLFISLPVHEKDS